MMSETLVRAFLSAPEEQWGRQPRSVDRQVELDVIAGDGRDSVDLANADGPPDVVIRSSG